MFAIDVQKCPVKCFDCIKEFTYYNVNKTKYAFLFDEVPLINKIRKYFDNIDDIININDIQMLFLSKLGSQLDKTMLRVYHNCADMYFRKELGICSPEMIFCFGEISLRYIMQKEVNVEHYKILHCDNNIYKGFVVPMPSFDVIFRKGKGFTVDKYNPMLLESRWQLQITKAIMDQETQNKNVREL